MRTTILRASQYLRKRKDSEYATIQIEIESKKELKMLIKKFELENGVSYPIMNTIPEDSVYRKLIELKNFYKL